MNNDTASRDASNRTSSLSLMKTGVPGLDEILGGGLPSLSFNLIAGGPGSGKTTTALQILFANASTERPGLFITLLGETSLKMLRYQQQFEFFEIARVGTDVHFLNLSEEALEGELTAVLDRIIAEVDRLRPGVVVIDSFRSLVHIAPGQTPNLALEHFVQKLALHLTTWEITSFLIGEYQERELRNPVFTVADGIFWLSQETHRNSVVRKLQVVKARGVAPMPGLHTARMTAAGMQVFPRIPENAQGDGGDRVRRLSTGVPGLDEMMNGGVPVGDSLVLAGPAGTGKTTFALQFAAAGIRVGETAVIAIFEERSEIYLERAKRLDLNLSEAVRDNKLRIIYLRPLDLSVDETLDEIQRAVKAIGATRVVIDSISGFEMALAPGFREDFRESLYRLIGALTSLGVTMYSTIEVAAAQGDLQLTGYQVSFLTDDIISLRYVEMEGGLRKVLMIVKMRGSNHSREFRLYETTLNGVALRESLRDYDSVLQGYPKRQLRALSVMRAGLTGDETLVLESLLRSGTLSRAEIARQTGVRSSDLDAMLARLVQLRYATQDQENFRAEHRPRDS